MKTPTLWVCGALSLAAHFFLLPSWQTPSGFEAAPPPPIQVRTIAMPTQGSKTPQVTVAAAPSSYAPSVPIEDTRTPTEPEQLTHAFAAPTIAATNLDEVFIPRPKLSIAPVAQTPVVLPDMDEQIQSGRFAGILALYIDETGHVHHIQPLEPRLPPKLEKSAIDTFMAVQFTPGQLNGNNVKSRIKLEVVFEKTPVTSSMPFQ